MQGSTETHKTGEPAREPFVRKGDNPMSLLKFMLVLAALGAIIWPIGAGMAGYTLGSPPASLDVSCYQIMRADWIIPMWKAGSTADCQPNSSLPPGEVATLPVPTGTTPICDDPNAATDGNLSGEMPCP